MISRMSKKLSSFFAANSIIKQEDTEVYEYSLEILLSTILNFLAVIAIAVFTRTSLLTLFYLSGFIPLRLIAGGYHADTHFRCFLVLLGTYSAFLAIISFTPDSFVRAAALAAVVVTAFLIFLLAPVEDKNKPVPAEAQKAFKLKSRIAVFVYTAVTVLLLFTVPGSRIAFALALGTASVALSLLATKIKNRVIGNAINA